MQHTKKMMLRSTHFKRAIEKYPNFLISLAIKHLINPNYNLIQFHQNSTLPLSHYLDYYYINDKIINSNQNLHFRQIHAQIILSGFYSNNHLVSKFIDRVSGFGKIEYARKVFDEMPEPNVFTWNSIIGGYCMFSKFNESVEMYVKMLAAGVCFNSFTVTKVLKACSREALMQTGRGVHGQTFKLGFVDDVFVQNGIVSFYAKCGCIDQAKTVFDGLGCRTVVSWTAIISGCAQHGCAAEALRLFSEMRSVNTKPDWITLVSVLRACTDLEYFDQGMSLHGVVIKIGLGCEEDLHISLTALYAKCGEVIVARHLFDQIVKPNVILCNAMISGYAKNGYAEEAVELFKILARKDVVPDSITIRAAILACAQLGSPSLAKWMNDYVTKTDCQNQVFVRTALVDMYAKCGNVDLARQEFDGILEKDVVCWSAMIVGYGLHGQAREAISLYDDMLKAGVRPNDVTFVGLLTACKNSGLVKEGWDFFHSMKDHGIEPRQQHYACIVDLISRAGFLGQAFKFIVSMPIEPGLTVWAALLSSCKIHRHVQMGEYAAAQVFSINPYDTGHHVQLSNLYAANHMWDRVPDVRKIMKIKGLSKDFGYSLVEVNGKFEVFRSGDTSHPRNEEIWQELGNVDKRLKEVGYAPDIESALHDLSSEDLQESLCSHSERLAIAYGLIATPRGSTLHIIKNLRTCVDCHVAIKLISKVTAREIIVRDVNLFHHFKDGVCSCGDYW